MGSGTITSDHSLSYKKKSADVKLIDNEGVWRSHQTQNQESKTEMSSELPNTQPSYIVLSQVNYLV